MMADIQKEVEVAVFSLFREFWLYPKNPSLDILRVLNWHVSYSLIHYFVFLNDFAVRAGVYYYFVVL